MGTHKCVLITYLSKLNTSFSANLLWYYWNKEPFHSSPMINYENDSQPLVRLVAAKISPIDRCHTSSIPRDSLHHCHRPARHDGTVRRHGTKSVSVRVAHFHKSRADAVGNRYKFTKRQLEYCWDRPKEQTVAGNIATVRGLVDLYIHANVNEKVTLFSGLFTLLFRTYISEMVIAKKLTRGLRRDFRSAKNPLFL